MIRAILAVGILGLAACESDPYRDLANGCCIATPPPVYGERPGEDQAFADRLIFGPHTLAQSGASIERKP